MRMAPTRLGAGAKVAGAGAIAHRPGSSWRLDSSAGAVGVGRVGVFSPSIEVDTVFAQTLVA
jgi:hypothetical protein